MKTKFTLTQSGRPCIKSVTRKSSISLLTFLLLINVSFNSNAQTIWNSGSFTFLFTTPGQFDGISPQSHLTRQTVLYNAVCQTVTGMQGCSYQGPCNTLWSIGNIANWNTLTYQPLYTALPCPGPTDWIGIPIVCHLLAENIYLQLTFNTWTPGTNGSFSYTRTTGSALPVTISKFDGYLKENIHMLEWTSNMESNCSHYNIQRSSNGIDFITLGREDSKTHSGNSSIDINYDYTDAHPAPGHNYYRLEQMDRHGQKNYSKVVDILFKSSGSTINIFQNPDNSQVKLSISTTNTSKATLTLADMSGRILKTINTILEAGNNDFHISLDDEADGMYIVHLYEDNRLSFTGKVVKQH